MGYRRKQIITYHYTDSNYDFDALKNADFTKLGKEIKVIKISIFPDQQIVQVVVYGSHTERLLIAGLIRRLDPNWRKPPLYDLELMKIGQKAVC